MTNLQHIRRTSFMALLVMVMFALAPTISKLQAFVNGAEHSMEVCTANGTTWLSASVLGLDAAELDLNHKSAPLTSLTHGEDCPFCYLQTTFFIGTQQSFRLPIFASNLLPLLFPEAQRPLLSWATQPARAPPSAL